MDTLINVVVVLAMIAIAAFIIHLLNTRHRHQHLRPAHYDHGLAGFGDAHTPGSPSGQTLAVGSGGPDSGTDAGWRDAGERRKDDVSGPVPDPQPGPGPASQSGPGPGAASG
ncbi:hypothetical protein [Streptomyces sp. NPDC052042]|uniref:hypothetical protein n=1 Tax=Streptomyces sp. NPDC052042 TaxID=3365683 RepID=UPI0037D540E9